MSFFSRLACTLRPLVDRKNKAAKAGPKPPQKASALLLLALECLEDALATGRYVYDPDCWHFHSVTPGRGPDHLGPGRSIVEGIVDPQNLRTRIDLSGAIMVKLGTPWSVCRTPSDFSPEWAVRFHALTFLQRGMTRVAGLKWDRCATSPPVDEYVVPPRGDDPEAFRRVIRDMARNFQEHNA